jgi:hypothetical protein
MSAYLQANSYQVISLAVRAHDTGRPLATLNASP